ncbi:MAG: pyrroline-5-carboxylate reductase [Chitinophagales bacterium]|nr:pyrroline-5-carboxylate reductase [Chitinophagales bacterium]
MKILIIGGGNMGLTYAQSFLRSHITSKEDMMILEKSPQKAQELAKKDIGTVYGNAEECIRESDLVILAVKPQDSSALFAAIQPLIDPQQVFLSIMAGVKIETIAEKLGAEKVIRAMPNLPAQIGMGMTAFTSSDAVTRIELVMVQNLLNTTGKTVYVENEDAIDAATAISGSGPAYVWFFMKSLMDAARNMGFNYSESELLVSQTFRGAIELFNKTEFTCEEWIEKVCSRGGTTEAALTSYEQTSLGEDIISGANAALNRAVELGKAK